MDPRKESERVLEWRRRNRGHYLAYQKTLRERPDHKRKERDAHLRREFGITVEQYEEMLHAQGGGCAICGRAPGATSRSTSTTSTMKAGFGGSVLPVQPGARRVQ